MLSRLTFPVLQKGLVLFWSIWFTLVATTNLFDALKWLNVLPEGWTLVSNNFDLVRETVGAHGAPASIAAVLFVGAIAWEALAAGLLWRAYAIMLRGEPGTADEVTQAFTVGLALWAAFLVATELTVDYATATTHKSTLIAQLVSLIVIRSNAGVVAGQPGPRLRAP